MVSLPQAGGSASSGKLCARKRARIVWEGGNGKGLAGALLHSGLAVEAILSPPILTDSC
jgi:hypothetical protein